MNIVRCDTLEDCFDGSRVFGYRFDAPWSREAIERLSALGRLEYFASFPRPFFRLRTDDGAEIKGVEGEPTCRAVFPTGERRRAQERFEGLFEVEQIRCASPSRQGGAL